MREKPDVLGFRTTVGEVRRGDRVLLEVALGRVVVRDGAVTRVGVVGTVLAARGRATFDRVLEVLLLGAGLERLARLARGLVDFARGLVVDRDARGVGFLVERDAFDLPADGLARWRDDALRDVLDELRFGGAPANAVAPTSETAANDAVISQVQDLPVSSVTPSQRERRTGRRAHLSESPNRVRELQSPVASSVRPPLHEGYTRTVRKSTESGAHQ